MRGINATQPLTTINRLGSTPLSHGTSSRGYNNINNSEFSLDEVHRQLWTKGGSPNIHSSWGSNTTGFGNRRVASLWSLLKFGDQQMKHICSNINMRFSNVQGQPLIAKISPYIYIDLDSSDISLNKVNGQPWIARSNLSAHTSWKSNSVWFYDSLENVFSSTT